ncbi:MAG: GYDIA family GHMP kinase [Bacteroidota bacterium]
MQATYYSNGKLLLTAEYGVLDGALALALPTKYGQSLKIQSSDSNSLYWESLDANGEVWFKANFDPNTFNLVSSSNRAIAQTLEKVLGWAKQLNPEFYDSVKGAKITSQLTFPRNWGLGSSSTLINNIAQWASVNPYELLQNTFGGSGYDIACAQHNSPILYQLKDGNPIVESTAFAPPFKDQLFFVYLNQKQNSRDAIANYRKQAFDKDTLVEKLSILTKKFLQTEHINAFESLLRHHEAMLSKVLKTAPVKQKLFPDYFGTIKSLGGWGGDFVLVTGNEKTPDYFKVRGFDVVVPFKNMAL